MLTFDEKRIFAPQPERPCDRPHFFGERGPGSLPERVEDIARHLRDTLDRLHMFEETLTKKYDDRLAVLTQDNVTFKNLMTDGWNDFVSTVRAEVNLFESDIQATLALFENSTNEQMQAHLQRITEAEAYMKVNLNNSLDALLRDMEDSGALAGVIESDVMLTPEKFGAVGDGQTDDTAALQSAYNEAATTGKPLHLAKVYKVTELHVDIDNSTIEGGGQIIGNIRLGGNGVTVSGVRLHGFRLDGSIYIRRLRLSEIDSIRFTGAAEYCILRDDGVTIPQHQTGYNTVRNCVMSTGASFILLTHQDNDGEFPFNDWTISGNIANPVKDSFITAEHLDGAKIDGNYIQYYDYTSGHKKGTGININFSDWVQITGNTIFEAGAHGVRLNNSRHFNIADNTIAWCGQNSLADGVFITGGFMGGQLQKGAVCNNVISQPSRHGVYVEDGGFINIAANVIRFTYSPVYLDKGANIVSASDIAGVKHYAVGYTANTVNLYIAGNMAYGLNYMIDNPNIRHELVGNYSDTVGQVTVEKVKIDTGSGSSLDSLGARVISLTPSGARSISSITGEHFGREIMLYSANNEGTVIRSGIGNIRLANGEDFAMRENSILHLWHNGSEWVETGRTY